MAWQSSFNRKRLISAVCAVFIFGSFACGRQAVRASEKEFLADRIMQFDFDGQESAADTHIHSNREGSAGGTGTGGGGCGCN